MRQGGKRRAFTHDQQGILLRIIQGGDRRVERLPKLPGERRFGLFTSPGATGANTLRSTLFRFVMSSSEEESRTAATMQLHIEHPLNDLVRSRPSPGWREAQCPSMSEKNVRHVSALM